MASVTVAPPNVQLSSLLVWLSVVFSFPNFFIDKFPFSCFFLRRSPLAAYSPWGRCSGTSSGQFLRVIPKHSQVYICGAGRRLCQTFTRVAFAILGIIGRWLNQSEEKLTSCSPPFKYTLRDVEWITTTFLGHPGAPRVFKTLVVYCLVCNYSARVPSVGTALAPFH